MKVHQVCIVVVAVLWAAASDAREEPDAPASPNVLFIIADDLTYTALGCYGNIHVDTPNLDKLAARGVRFDAAYCQFPVCGQSRASMLAGLYPPTIKNTGGGRELDAILGPNVTLPEHFKLNGYTSARVSKLYHMRVPGDITSGAPGPDHADSWSMTHNVQAPEWKSSGEATHHTTHRLKFEHDNHYNLGFGTAFYNVATDTDGTEQADALAADKAIEWLETLKDGPFFLGVGLVRPHVPLVAPEAYFDAMDPATLPLAPKIPGDLDDIPEAGRRWQESVRGPKTDVQRRGVLQGYYASVAFMDFQVGRILDKLDELGLADNTIVVFTSDHGYHLGEHTQWQKLSLHQESAGVPLLIAGPGVPAGETDALVELIDLYPTLCAMTGLDIPGNVQGASLVPVLADNDAAVNTEAFSKTNQGDLLRTSRWAYMRYGQGGEELYDMLNDPRQYTNLVDEPGHAAILRGMRAALDSKLESMQP